MRLLVGPITAATRWAGEADHVLSLISPGAEAPRLTQPNTLLRFNDISEERDGLVVPAAKAVETILTLRATPTLLIHCFAGVSRSTAAAYILACSRRPAGEESDMAAQLRALSPEATPNPLMVSIADEILNRGGEMARAITRIGRGVDCFEGAAFEWILD